MAPFPLEKLNQNPTYPYPSPHLSSQYYEETHSLLPQLLELLHSFITRAHQVRCQPRMVKRSARTHPCCPKEKRHQGAWRRSRVEPACVWNCHAHPPPQTHRFHAPLIIIIIRSTPRTPSPLPQSLAAIGVAALIRLINLASPKMQEPAWAEVTTFLIKVRMRRCGGASGGRGGLQG